MSNLDYSTLDTLRRQHPGWRLLLADSAPLVVSFLHRSFVAPNVRVLPRAELASKLEDHLFQLRETLGDAAFPKAATQYLDDWAADERGWLRKFYPVGSDEPHYDLTPATEKAIAWLTTLSERAFVGTESRLLTVFELLRQMVTGSESDPEARIRELESRKAEIDAEIGRIRNGEISLLDDTGLRDRFQQIATTANGLLTDFREVEQNFRGLDRSVRERIALWEGGKGALLESIFGERDAIADSDQGRSFRAFWDFLMAPARQEELTELLDVVFTMPAIAAFKPDARLKRMHYDWLEAGEHTQRTIAYLSQQLRRFLDDKVWLENRRIMEVLREIEAKALAVRESPPGAAFMTLDEAAPDVELPMERPLFSPPIKAAISDQLLSMGEDASAADALFEQIYVDKARLAANIRRVLQTRAQVTLADLVAQHPLEQGLAELIAYLSLASEDRSAVIDDAHTDALTWIDARQTARQARLPRVIFCK
jgi:hypothetical protein